MLKADGCAFLGQIKDCGVLIENKPLIGPLTRPAPTQFKDVEEKVERITVTQADLGAVVEFINFKPVFESQAIGKIVEWGTILIWILSFHKTPDLLAMCKAMDQLPSGQGGVGSWNSRSKVKNALWLSHYRDTGLNLDTNKPPKGGDLEWANEQIKKQDEKKALLAGLVQKTKAKTQAKARA